jgi:pimeloyl-ACP methyl ester carboxylesterase
MKRIDFLLLVVAAVAIVAASADRGAGHADDEAAPIFGVKIPPGYRDWRLISVAHEEGNLNDFRAILGNDVAIKAYREGKLPFPHGKIIARLAWSYLPSEENNKVFGHPQSFVAGPPKNGVQFMVKDSRKYFSTGGWGFAQFDKGIPAYEALLGRLGYDKYRHDFAKLIWQLASPKSRFDAATFDRSAAAFNNPDHVSIVIHNYRWRLSLAEGEPKYDDLEKRLAGYPVITVPTITLDGDANGAPHPDAKSYGKKFSGKYSHRLIKGGIGHNLPQEAPQVFAKAGVDVDRF